jgi:transducin (beta)-like 1
VQYAEPITLLNTAPQRTIVKREARADGERAARASMEVDLEGGPGDQQQRLSGAGSGSARDRDRGGGGVERGSALGAAAAAQDESTQIAEQDVCHLVGHSSEVFICAWSPTASLLASGSGDATARIWSVPEGPVGGSSGCRAVVLNHTAPDQGRAKDVTTLDWSPLGAHLATGSYDGKARVWTAKGELLTTLGGAASGGPVHEGPIFALKWNAASTLLLSGSVDKTAIVWDAATGAVRQQYRLHKAPTLDVDWRGDDMFATCSTDKLIHVCRVGEPNAVRTFAGHTDEVNCVKWGPRGRLLASCSDDCTARVWSVEQNAAVHTFAGHSKEIYTIKWSPVRL